MTVLPTMFFLLINFKYNEFAKTVEGEVMNLATAVQMVLARSGITR